MKIEEVIEDARAAVFASDTGDVIPMITLELSQNTLILALDTWNDSQSVAEQSGLAARYGFEQCLKYQGQRLFSASCYTVAWLTRDRAVGLRPNLDPKREEVLSVSVWQRDILEVVQTYDLPILRDVTGKVVDVGPVQEARSDQMNETLLAFFLYGAQDALAGNDTNLQAAEQKVEARLATLSPQQKRQLMRMLAEEEPWIIPMMKKMGYDR